MTKTFAELPRWSRRLEKELAFRPEFSHLDEQAWRQLLKNRRVASTNHDTVLSLDWPHFCHHATAACGGIDGWCYTFQGNQAGRLHNRHAAMVDVLARQWPQLFAEVVTAEVFEAVKNGMLPYPNLRYSGSGELVEAYLPALRDLQSRGVHLWGFTRSLDIARALRSFGAGVIVSCDRTSPTDFASVAHSEGFAIGYTSADVNDVPPKGTVVTFPIHRVGRVREVVASDTICPKVVADFLHDSRPKGSCQLVCRRCHKPGCE
jgi:hypothetical protein